MIDWMRARWRGALVVATAVAVTSALVAGGVMAQTPTPTPAKPGVTQKPGPAAKPDVAIETFLDKLAGRLGVPADRVKTEAKTVQKQMIDEAVAAGRITKEVGDTLKQRVDAGHFVLPHALRGPGKPAARLPLMREGLQAIATFLNMKVEDVAAELRAGKSLAKIADEHGKTRQQLIDKLVELFKARLDKAVAEQKLTQKQADEQLARFRQHVEKMVDRTHTPGAGPKGKRPGAPSKPGGSA